MGCGWLVLRVQPQAQGTEHRRKRSYPAIWTGPRGQGMGHREGQAARHQNRCPRLPVPRPQQHLRRLQTPEGEPAGQAGPQVPPAKKNSVRRCPAEEADCKEGRGDGAAAADVPAQLQTLTERAERGPCPSGDGGWGMGTTAPPAAAQRPAAPPLPGHGGSAPPSPAWWYSHVSTPESKLPAPSLSAEWRRFVKRWREKGRPRRPNGDRHTKA